MLTGWKTLIFNALGGLLALLEIGGVVDLLPAEWAPAVPLVIAVGNMVLRHYSDGMVAYKKK